MVVSSMNSLQYLSTSEPILYVYLICTYVLSFRPYLNRLIISSISGHYMAQLPVKPRICTPTVLVFVQSLPRSSCLPDPFAVCIYMLWYV